MGWAFAGFFTDLLELLSCADLLALVHLNNAAIKIFEEKSMPHNLVVLNPVDLDKVEIPILTVFILLDSHLTQNNAVFVPVAFEDPLQVLQADLTVMWHKEVLVRASQPSVEI